MIRFTDKNGNVTEWSPGEWRTRVSEAERQMDADLDELRRRAAVIYWGAPIPTNADDYARARGHGGFVLVAIDVPEWPPRGCASPKPEPPTRDTFAEVIDAAKRLRLVIGYDGKRLEEAYECEPLEHEPLTPAQRRQIADSMAAAWKEWASE